MAGDQDTGIGLGFIDILFAFVVGFGLEDVRSKPWVSDLFHNWLDRDLWMFVLANTVVVGSWIGYHGAMMHLRKEVDTRQSLLRFVIDVILLFEYFRLLGNIGNPPLVFAIIFQIFVWYVLWDLIVRTEGTPGKEAPIVASATVFWGLIFGITWLIARKVPWTSYENAEWLTLAAAGMIGTFLYRVHWVPWRASGHH